MPMRKFTLSLATSAAALALTMAPLTGAFAASPSTGTATSSSTEATQPMHPSQQSVQPSQHATQPNEQAMHPSQQAMQPSQQPNHEQWSHRTAVVQEALNSTGADLRVDGVWGPNTEQALKTYQRDHNLPVTGHLDHATMMHLDPIG
jgi:hypothetical protein